MILAQAASPSSAPSAPPSSPRSSPPPAAEALAARAAIARDARSPPLVTLPGLQYQVLRSGPAQGERASRGDDVTVRYTGRFIDGRVFNTSPDGGAGETTFPLQKLIPGWIAALQMMRPGDVWRLWLPPHLAYGWRGKAYIPPDSMLVFDVELVSHAPHPPDPTPAKP